MRFLVASLLLTLSAPALAEGGAAAKVAALLAGYEYVPTASDWARVGDAAIDVLIKRASDGRRDLLDRARSVSSLAHFPTKQVRAWLTTLRDDEAAPEVLRRKATAALDHAFPKSDPATRTPKPTLPDKTKGSP